MKDVGDAAPAGSTGSTGSSGSSAEPVRRAATPRWLGDDDPAPARVALTRRRVVDAALALVNERGLAGLTMRRLASELGVAPMSLYSHVADKAELIDLMVDHVLGVVHERLRSEGTWQERIRDLSHCFRQAWAEHPGLVVVYSTGITLGPNSIAVTEWLVGVLRRAGFSDRDAAYSLFALTEYVIGTLQFSPIRTAPGAQPADDGQFHSRIAEYFTAVPPATIPNMVAVDEHLNGDAFDYGLDLMIAGLEARLAGQRVTPDA